MPRGYRCVLIALVGWLSLAAAEPQAENKQQTTTSNQAEPAPPPYAPYANLSEDACYNAKDHNAADLCAQWRAAMAAEKAAEATEIATTWSKVSTALSALALGALIWTLMQTEKALGEARRANTISENAAELGLRAYVSFGIPKLKKVKPECWHSVFPIKNTGQTPASEVVVTACSMKAEMPARASMLVPYVAQHARKFADIGPNSERGYRFTHPLPLAERQAIRSGVKCLLFYMQISYTTYAGKRVDEDPIMWIVRETEFDEGAPTIFRED